MANRSGNFTVALDNDTAVRKSLTNRADNLIAGYTYIVLSIVGFTGSILCVWAIFTRRALRCPQARPRMTTITSIQPIFVSLCMSSLIFSVVCAFQAYSTLAGRRNFLAEPANDPLCQLIAFAYYMISPVDQLQHAALASHRFFAIVATSDRFARLRSRTCTAILVAVPWFLAALSGVLPFFHVGLDYGYNDELDRCFIVQVHTWRYVQFNKTFFIIFSLGSIVVCYTAIAVKVAVVHRRAMEVHVVQHSFLQSMSSVPLQAAPPPLPSRTIRSRPGHTRGAGVTKTVVALCVLFLVSFLPWMIYPLAAKTDVALNTPPGLTVVTLFLLGCAASPWLIVLLTPTLRNHVTGQLRRIGSSTFTT
uniref:G-protein coupled receptors family 1 profile domain-containing protein n=1 Tax=Hypsibius exemplaris TaxID=2072580 RepID=A0A1W0WB20_HYPEX|nr:hypothetical protein BV898_13355 [Hypsibius exemplaris]